MPYFADRVKETTATAGTGAVTLSGVAPTGFQTFAAGFGSGARVVGYCIQDLSVGAWEVGKGTFNGTTGLTRDFVHASSNANNLVSFASSTKDVFCTPSAEQLDNTNFGQFYTQARGFAMP